jgi:protein KTI12
MPLVTICGLPLSGKTSRAIELKECLEKYISDNETIIKKVVLVNEESLSIDKILAYSSAAFEKKARGEYLSAVERYLNRETIVIVDGLNYIKGFRYQLYCIARGVGTPGCTLFVGSAEATLYERDEILKRYDPSMFGNLISRMEEPDGRNRWDAPLFIVIENDSRLSSLESKTSGEIIDAIIHKAPPKPNLSTINTPKLESSYLQQLDLITTQITDALMDAKKNGRNGAIIVPSSNVPVQLPSRAIAISEWKRVKRQFITIYKTRKVDVEGLGQAFVEYLNTTL